MFFHVKHLKAGLTTGGEATNPALKWFTQGQYTIIINTAAHFHPSLIFVIWVGANPSTGLSVHSQPHLEILD